MQYQEAKLGRVFVLRLEHGDAIPDIIEQFAGEQNINRAVVHFLGGADTGSKIVVGPEDGTKLDGKIFITELLGVSEAVGLGTIFPDEEGRPKLHLHSAFGRQRDTITGCTREGVQVWQIGEVIIWELLGTCAKRKADPKTGFELLHLEEHQ